MNALTSIITIIVVFYSIGHAETLSVPAQYPTIMSAVQAAVDGDTVLLADGIYTGAANKNIDFLGKAILITSENGPGNCSIDCEHDGRGFYFQTHETSSSILANIKIINGYAADLLPYAKGGAVYCDYASPLIINCIFEACSTYTWGGAVCLYRSNAHISNCQFDNNSSTDQTLGNGGGLAVIDSSCIISSCQFTGNSAMGSGGAIYFNQGEHLLENCTFFSNYSANRGGAVHAGGYSDVTFSHCTFVENSCEYEGGAISISVNSSIIENCVIYNNTCYSTSYLDGGGGIYVTNSSSPIRNCIIENNHGRGGIYIYNSPGISIEYCDSWDNELGNYYGFPPPGLGTLTTHNLNGDSCDIFHNISANPVFTNASAFNFNLRPESPCIDAGDPNSHTDPDGTITDMGVYYLQHSSHLVIFPSQLIFFAGIGGENPMPQTCEISNSGIDFFNFNILENAGYLTINPLTGGPVPPNSNINVSIDITGLTPATYYYHTIIQAEGALGNPDTLLTTLYLTVPELTVSPQVFNFTAEFEGANPLAQFFTVDNYTFGTFTYFVEENIDWLTVQPAGGGPVPPAATETISVSTTGMPVGLYQGNINVTAPGALSSPQTLEVNLEIQGPVLALSVDSLGFEAVLGGGNPAPQYFTISNASVLSFDFEIDESSGWLIINPIAGGPVPPDAVIDVSTDITGLQAGNYFGQAVITAPAAQNSPDTIEVYLYLRESSTIIRIPDDFPTIQAGINAAVDGDTVLVSPGTYAGVGNKELDFSGKAIIVMSENGPENCIIDCDNSGRGFYFHSGESENSVLDGFKIIEGNPTISYGGGGIRIANSGPTIRNCLIQSCISVSGAGINAESSNFRIEDCIISGNHFSYGGYGGGMHFANCNAEIINCQITGNGVYTEYGSTTGGGISCFDSDLLIQDSNISGNYTMGGYNGFVYEPQSSGGGISCYENSNLSINGCEISYNYIEADWRPAWGGGIYCDNSSMVIESTVFSQNGNLFMNESAQEGGAISAHNSQVEIYSCKFDSNSVYSSAGAIKCESSDVAITQCEFINNESGNVGGAIDCNASTLNVSNSVFISNTITGISAPGSGSAVYYQSNSMTVENSIFYLNQGVGVFHFVNSAGASVSYCDFWLNPGYLFWGQIPTGLFVLNYTNANGDVCDQYYNIYMNPLFASISGDSAYHLTAESPCIDAGNPLSPYDPDSTIADIGRYYFDQMPQIQVTISISGSDVILNWTAIPSADSYYIYRSSTPYFEPNSQNLLWISPGENYFADENALQQPCYYYFVTWE